ncbi:hypothetical protein BDF20DRAFT_906483 [Mycotypha africana]|uniref:uncharacterized protein n=1 Tax=Mycotypha africana TaxID=64632 RepID=UPI002300601E|nr:uncharacterized protein BDF20DRAFT_906483 [Mycotypha africana]KAI8977472.1 hypothetical protein BDF20DRAFT_906483 [Mycotypha africana]
MSTNSPRPFTTVAGNGLRPYYTPGLNTNNNYTTVPDAQSVAMPYASNNYDDLIDSKAAARELINFIVLKYMTSAVSSPFEVSRTLLQVQYMPRGNKELSSFSQTNNSDKGYSDNEEEQFSSDSGEEEEEDIEEEFFENARYRRRKHHSDDDNLNSSTLNVDDPVFKQKMDVDASGYVVQTSVYDESTRPPHQMKPIEGGVWSGIKKLMKQPHEGWRSLFKGQYTNWLYDISHLFLQPTLEGSLNDLFGLYDDTIPLVHLDNVGPNLATLVASNLLVGVFLSPLELIRTR